MSITTKKPMIKETVGALYYDFNTPDSNGDFTTSYESDIAKSNVVKSVDTTENADSVVVRASGQDYETVNQNESIDINLEVVAIDPADLAKMRADVVAQGGLNRSGRANRRPYFAFGKVKKLVGGGKEFAWYPKCQLVNNSDSIATKEESFSEQNDTITIRAYAYNENGDKKTYVNSEMSNFPEGLTEELFFSKPILEDSDLASVLPVSSSSSAATPTYAETSDETYQEGKDYYSKDGNTYTKLTAGTDYTVGSSISGTVYEEVQGA